MKSQKDKSRSVKHRENTKICWINQEFKKRMIHIFRIQEYNPMMIIKIFLSLNKNLMKSRKCSEAKTS